MTYMGPWQQGHCQITGGLEDEVFVSGCVRPAEKEHRPERGDARQDQQSETNARALSFGVQALNTKTHEWHRKQQSKAGVYRQGVNNRFGEDVKHLYRKPGSQIR